MSLEEAILEKVRSLSPEKQQAVLDFAEFLAQKAEVTNSSNKGSFEDEPFVGMWRDREDMSDSSAWVRRTRLGESLGKIRDKIIASGEPLLNQEELEKEIASRRGGIENREE